MWKLCCVLLIGKASVAKPKYEKNVNVDNKALSLTADRSTVGHF